MAMKTTPTPSQPDSLDETISDQLAATDSETVTKFFDAHAVSLFSLALHIVNDQREAETIVEQTFQYARQEVNHFDRERDSANSWLLRITRRLAVDTVRSRHVNDVTIDAATVQLPDPARRRRFDVASTDAADALRLALITLPRLERIAIELAYFEGLSPAQIAEHLGHPTDVIKDKVRMGLHTLRKTLEATA